MKNRFSFLFCLLVVFSSLFVSCGNKKSDTESNTVNGYEYVDLGLSVKWATCNVGASSPEDYGDYYAWGETSTKSNYNSSTSTTRGKEMSDIAGNAQYDVARKKWGSSWRMPTKAEFQELVDNCTWTRTTQNGVNGCKVTSKKNGNSIFLPAAGLRSGSSSYFQGASGHYWSATRDESSIDWACYLYFNTGARYMDSGIRLGGYSVRPVSE